MKIVVDNLGRLGNNLFQYFFAKILAKELNCEFITSFKLPNLLGIEDKFSPFYSYTHVLSEDYVGKNKTIFKLNNKDIDKKIDDVVNEIKKLNPEILLVRGYFQNYDFYKNYKMLIKNSFCFPKNYSENTLGIHIRKGDIANTENDLDDDWFLQMVENFVNHKKYITTDSPNHPLIKVLLSKGCNLYQNSPEQTIIDFSNFSDLILSQGTFSWWMAYLSEGNKYNVLPDMGWNSKNSPIKLFPNEDKWFYYQKINNKYEKYENRTM